jgi:hypothetical protein
VFQVKIRDETLSPQFKERNKGRGIVFFTAGGVVSDEEEENGMKGLRLLQVLR